ncbi:MAG: ABC transporter permease subunit [Lentisphaeria bacterium]
MTSCRNIRAVCARELSGYFTSPVAYVFILFFLLLSGVFTFKLGGFFAGNDASLAAFFVWLPWLYLFLVPAIGMRLWAEERRAGTLELLLTMPLTGWQAILGKFLAAWAVLLAALLLTFPLLLTVAYLGEPDLGALLGGYLGALLLAGAFLAVSSMTSALTRNQVISFILSLCLCLFLNLAGWPPVTGFLVRWAPPWLIDGVAQFSVYPHFSAMQKGLVELRGLVYFLSVILFGLFTTAVILRNRRTR